ncbi:hypothetical protein EGW08_008079 [Elysia chlorotica]|uniref:Prokineticin domain-containing protein n=1 Tax=Elysia chlorotica TaxID=188477 RepID=A0A433TRI7_ELYCH|nr:hypothetical protein EGW08_008079 [Elysia chlorotica]
MLRAVRFTILAFVALSLCVHSIAACIDDSDCGENECCQSLSTMPFISKRDVEVDLSDGVCQPYIQQGGDCITFTDYTGICGCAPSLTCTVPNRDKRRVSWDRQGTCETVDHLRRD